MSIPSLIALDWGTTSLRAYLLDERGAAIESRTEPWGVMRLPAGGFAEAFRTITHAWGSLPAIACGMVGSTHGWVAAPYRDCPAGLDELAAALTDVPNAKLRVVPGLALRGPRPDVMRGEETQIVGAIALRPTLAERSTLLLPGTHAKWARVVDGRVRAFTTFMTGELFATLRDHSILGRPARDASHTRDAVDAATFALGVRAAYDAPLGVSPLLFSARALVLDGRLDAATSLDYLSGLLLGDELRCALADYGAPDALVGDAALCARYADALALVGHPGVPVVDDASPAGLWRIAEHARMISA